MTLRSTPGGTCRREVFPSRPWEDCLCACLDSRLHNCGPRSGQLYSRYVPQRPEISQRPYGKITDVLASTLFRTTAADALVNYSLMYLLQETLNISHRPHGRLHVLLVVCTGRRCLRRFRHGHDNVFLDLRKYSCLCACSCSKVPIALMGKLLTCLPRLTLAQLLTTLRSTAGGACRSDLQKFP